METTQNEKRLAREASETMDKRPRHNCIIDHVVCASGQSPMLNHVGLIGTKPKTVSITEFFPEGDQIELPVLTLNGSNGNPGSLEEIFVRTNENEMRNGLATFLRDCIGVDLVGLHKINRRRPAIAFNPRQYIERDMRTLFRDISDGNPSTNMRRMNVALPVTATSGCDIISLRGANMLYQREPCMGEMKNAEKYGYDEGRNQAILYCLAHLYDARVIRGYPMETAYGFAVNGPNVPGVEAYTVTLVRVRAPSELSKYHSFEVHNIAARNFQDTLPLQTLVHFLQRGRVAHFPQEVIPRPMAEHRRSPCRFLLPTGLWSNDNENDGKLFLSGTFAIVFQGHMDCLVQILQEHAARPSKQIRNAIAEFTEDFEDSTYVLKIQYPPLAKNLDVDHDFLLADPDLAITYPIDVSNGFIFMRFRGDRIDSRTFTTMESLKQAFGPVWESTMHLSRSWHPGDSLPHNMVYDGQALHLIDADEAFTPSLSTREPPQNLSDDNWLEAVRYPDFLLEYRWAYTLVQLSYSAFVICNFIPTDGRDKKDWGILHINLRVTGKILLAELRKHNRDKRVIRPTFPATRLPDDLKGSLMVLADVLPRLLNTVIPQDFSIDFRG